jgi:hypothetical protein
MSRSHFRSRIWVWTVGSSWSLGFSKKPQRGNGQKKKKKKRLLKPWPFGLCVKGYALHFFFFKCGAPVTPGISFFFFFFRGRAIWPFLVLRMWRAGLHPTLLYIYIYLFIYFYFISFLFLISFYFLISLYFIFLFYYF